MVIRRLLARCKLPAGERGAFARPQASTTAARFHGGSFIESIRAPGNNAVGLGIPWWEPGGGENHPDAVVTMQSMWIGGEQIVRDGVLVPPELAKLEAAIEPIAA